MAPDGFERAFLVVELEVNGAEDAARAACLRGRAKLERKLAEAERARAPKLTS